MLAGDLLTLAETCLMCDKLARGAVFPARARPPVYVFMNRLELLNDDVRMWKILCCLEVRGYP